MYGLEALAGVGSLLENEAHCMSDSTAYALGYTDIEHDRLMRQAARFHGFTEAFLREAGVAESLRVLDLGSGVGDVAMLTAHIVGPSGEVVGIERDSRSVEYARARVDQAGLANVTFRASDIANITDAGPFDAVVGRFILQFVPDPVAALRSVSRLLRPRGIVAFQEVAWTPARAANGRLPLWSACATIVEATMRRIGANTDAGLALHANFAAAGIPPPQMNVDMHMGASREHVLWPYDLLRSVRAGMSPDQSIAPLGDLDTLAERLMAEVHAAHTAVTSIAVIGARSRLA